MKLRIRSTARLSFPLASALAAVLAAPSASAAIYYRDNVGAAGFGTAGGTWAAPTISQWSTDPTGVAPAEASITITGGPAAKLFGRLVAAKP